MKKLLGGLKPKEFLLNHGEKIGFGVILFVVAIALLKTEWSRYAKAPHARSISAN